MVGLVTICLGETRLEKRFRVEYEVHNGKVGKVIGVSVPSPDHSTSGFRGVTLAELAEGKFLSNDCELGASPSCRSSQKQ